MLRRFMQLMLASLVRTRFACALSISIRKTQGFDILLCLCLCGFITAVLLASGKAPYAQKAYAAYARVASEDQVRLRVQYEI